MVAICKERLGRPLRLHDSPQIVGALETARFTRDYRLDPSQPRTATATRR